MSIVSIPSGSPSNESVLPSIILEILDNTLYPEFLSKTFWNFVYIDLPWGDEAAIDNFSETTFIMATELDRDFPFSSRDNNLLTYKNCHIA